MFMLLGLLSCGSTDEIVDVSADSTTSSLRPEDTQLGSGHYRIADLEVQMTPADAKAFQYVITCLGDTATVVATPPDVDLAVDGESACSALNDSAVRDRLFAVGLEDRICTEIFGSADAAVITGSLEGEQVSTEVNRHNGCGIHDWDVVLADLLPAIR